MLMDNISFQYSKFWPGLKINEDRNTILLRQAMKGLFYYIDDIYWNIIVLFD